MSNGNAAGGDGSSLADLRSLLLASCERLLRLETMISRGGPPPLSLTPEPALSRDTWAQFIVTLRILEQDLVKVRNLAMAIEPPKRSPPTSISNAIR